MPPPTLHPWWCKKSPSSSMPSSRVLIAPLTPRPVVNPHEEHVNTLLELRLAGMFQQVSQKEGWHANHQDPRKVCVKLGGGLVKPLHRQAAPSCFRMPYRGEQCDKLALYHSKERGVRILITSKRSDHSRRAVDSK